MATLLNQQIAKLKNLIYFYNVSRRGGTDEEKWGKMGKNGEKIYGEFGSGRVVKIPLFFTIFPHDFFLGNLVNTSWLIQEI